MTRRRIFELFFCFAMLATASRKGCARNVYANLITLDKAKYFELNLRVVKSKASKAR